METLLRPGKSVEKEKENIMSPSIQKGKASAKTEEITKRPVATNRSTNGPKESSLWMRAEDLLTLEEICAAVELPVGVDLEASLGGGADGQAEAAAAASRRATATSGATAVGCAT